MTSTRALATEEWPPGTRIVVGKSAGARLGGRTGMVLGFGSTRSRLRVLLDGSRGPITLHVSFISRLEGTDVASDQIPLKCEQG
jgi:hypothetical protein